MNVISILDQILRGSFSKDGVTIFSDRDISPRLTSDGKRIKMEFSPGDLTVSYATIIKLKADLEYLSFDVNGKNMYVKAKGWPMEITVDLEKLK